MAMELGRRDGSYSLHGNCYDRIAAVVAAAGDDDASAANTVAVAWPDSGSWMIPQTFAWSDEVLIRI